MTEKVKCIDENCSAMILPTTADDTGGFCMPCTRTRVTPNKIRNYLQQEPAYKHLAVEGKQHIICFHCRLPVLLCENVDVELKHQYAKLRVTSVAEAQQMLNDDFGLDYKQAKATMLHMRSSDGSCHNCNTQLRRGSLLCPRCLAVNLDWTP